jgi:DNA-binding NarL/FixJ family response regulator
VSSAETAANSAITVLIAEANRMNCQLVQSAFQRGRQKISVVGATVDAANALSVLHEHDPDIAVVSARMISGPVDGFGLVRDIRALKSRTRVVMLLESRERQCVVDAFRFGAKGVVFRDEPLQILNKCIKAVHGGQIWANSQIFGYVVEALAQAMPFIVKDVNGTGKLTKREREIVDLLCMGLSNRDIAAQLKLSDHTIRNYVQHIFDKLGVSNRTELAVYWFQHGPRAIKDSVA